MIFLLFPHQLFEDITALRGKKVLLIEEPLLFSGYTFHIQKLIMHRASMRAYEAYLRLHEIDVRYCEDECYLEIHKEDEVCVYDVVDFYLAKKLSQNFTRLTTLPHPNFINAKDSSKFLHSYYINRRKDLGILLDEEQKPLGGKWSFDSENRKKIPKGTKIALTLSFSNPYIDEAKEYVKEFVTLGECEDFYHPTTFEEAKMMLHHFLSYKFANFGVFQDAIVESESFLFHANIANAINIGILSLSYVIESVVAFEGVSLSAKEGFLRQIIGWREFMLRIYKDDGVPLRNANFFGAKNKIPDAILESCSGITPLDESMKRLKKTAYAHHIERLMVFGNLFMLLGIDPHEMHSFFMRYFIDAYDWVMVGNVYAMVAFSDGGSFTTKPYIASSNYILKMSDYKRGEWCEIVDGLYWSFLDQHKEKLQGNIRMKMQYALLAKMPEEKLEHHKSVAFAYKKSLGLL